MSLAAWQTYAGMHLLPWQFDEQHAGDAPDVQALPSVRQALVVETTWQVPLVQTPEQHSAAPPQAVPVVLQAVSPHRPFTQASEQHSLGFAQVAPGVLQKLVEVQVLVVALQAVEQHAEPAVQALPLGAQVETGAAHCCVDGLQ